jgi:hypothetical protein
MLVTGVGSEKTTALIRDFLVQAHSLEYGLQP